MKQFNVTPPEYLNTEPHGYYEGDVPRELVFDSRRYQVLTNEVLGGGFAWYPRLKKLSENDYILFWQNGRWGPDILFSKSKDLKSWSSPRVLIASHEADGYIRHYATLDAVQLKDGTLVASACFHAPGAYVHDMKRRGLVCIRSYDGGESWTTPEIIYSGRTWEPYLLELPSGEIHLYLTHSAPKYAIHDKALKHVSSGVALLRSFDGGKSWNPKVFDYPYAAYRIIQQQTGELDGIKICTDQMPVARLLPDGTIAVALESERLVRPGHDISLAYSNDNWAHEVDIDKKEAPSDRINRVCVGVGPYLSIFPSGETVLSCSQNGILSCARLGNQYARNFSEKAIKLFNGSGIWLCTEVTQSHTLTAAMGNVIIEPEVKNNLRTNGIMISHLQLNHPIRAKNYAAPFDGTNNGWESNTDALWADSGKGSGTSVRCAYDENYIYLLCECFNEPSLRIKLKGKEEDVLLELTPDKALLPEGIEAKNTVYPGEGIVYEMKIPSRFLAENISLSLDAGTGESPFFPVYIT